jgi:SpoVK/Ycf46/Vps4 family AAA+-type ATPase
MKINILFLLLILSNLSVFSKGNKLNDLVEIKEFETMVGPHPKALARLVWYVQKHGQLPGMNRLLLYGPPGTGKTKYAEEIARALNCNFLKMSGSNFINRYIGTGAANVKECFKKALFGGDDFSYQFNPNLPTVLFIDEVDVITHKSDETGEYKQAAAALWTELDNVKGNRNIFVIMATNNRDGIPATILNRLGTNQVVIDLPDPEKRRKLFKRYLNEDSDLKKDLNFLVKKSKGMSSRAIEDACGQAIEAADMDDEKLTKEILVDHLEKIQNPSDLNWIERVYKKLGENKEKVMLTTTGLSIIEVLSRIVSSNIKLFERSRPGINIIQAK